MNKRTFAMFFFIIALILAAVLGLLEFWPLLSKGSSTSAGARMCKVKSQQEVKDVGNILWSDGSYFVSAKNPEALISLHHWSVDPEIKTGLNSELSLFCERPGYFCIPKKDALGKEVQVNVRSFVPPNGMAEVSFSGHKKLFPFSWDSKSNKALGTPLGFCGQTLDLDKVESHLTSKYFIVYEPRRSLLAFYPIAVMKGSVLQSAEVEPESLYQISSQGVLFPGTCSEQKGQSEPVKTVLYRDTLLLLTKSHQLRLFNLGGSISPKATSVDSVQRILNADKEGFWTLAMSGDYHKYSFDGAPLAEPISHPKYIEKDDDTDLQIWSERKVVVGGSSRQWFGSYELNVGGEVFTWDPALYRAGKPYEAFNFLNQHRLAVLNQSNDASGKFSLIECD